MSTQNAIVSVIHDRVGEVLRNVFAGGDALFSGSAPDNPFKISTDGSQSLIAQLSDGSDGPPKISIGFVLDVAGSAVSALVADLNPSFSAPTTGSGRAQDLGGIVDKVKGALAGRLKLFDEQETAVANLITARSPATLHEAGLQLFESIRNSASSGAGGVFSAGAASRLQQLIGSDVGTVLPLATIAQALQRSRAALQNAQAIPESIEQALLAYFFKPTGYRTLDELNLVSPVHLSDVQTALEAAVKQTAETAAKEKQLTVAPQLAGLFSRTTAEHYLRDITRVIVESAYDAGRGLKGPDGRYEMVKSGLRALPTHGTSPDATVTKFVAWFRGFGSMAESATMRAVEVGTQGVSEFQTNPLIAAAAGSFAGTVARKLSQDSFLGVLAADLKIPDRRL